MSFIKLITAALLIGANLSAQAVATSQTIPVEMVGRSVTINVSDVPLGDVLSEIQKQSGVKLTYSADIVPLNRLVTLDVNAIGVGEALRVALKGTGVDIRPASGGRIGLVKISGKQSGRTQGVISGRVIDAKSGRGVSGATVSIENGSRGVMSGEEGEYRLTGVAAGTHTVSVRLVGYAKQTRSVTVGEGTTVTVDFKLEPSASVLNEVVVTGTVIATELKAVPSAITVVTAKQIEERGITHIDQLFRGEIPGLFAQNTASNNPLEQVTMFSRGATRMQEDGDVSNGKAATNAIKTYIDGVELADPSYLSQIDPSSIERIEVLTGPQASTIYGSNALNGVMQIFTKRGATQRPQLALNLMEGFIQSNLSSALTPMHTYDGRVSGIEGRMSYNVGGSWNYLGAWTPAKQTQRTDAYAGGRAQFGKLTADASLRGGLTKNKLRSTSTPIVTAREESGESSPSSLAPGRFSPRGYTLNGQSSGLTLNYAPVEWWSQELVLGMDGIATETLGKEVGNRTVFDSLLFLSQSRLVRNSQRYSSTMRGRLGSLGVMTAIVGADHWRTTSSSLTASGITTTGPLSSPTVTRDRAGKNTGGFVQTQIGINDALFLTYGLRAEWNPNYGEEAQPNVAPRYGIAYSRDIGPISAKLRGSFGRATRPPASDQKISKPANLSNYFGFYGPFNTQLANTALEPESQQGGEGGIELYFGNVGSLVVTRYNQTVDQLIINYPRADSVRSLTNTTFIFNSRDDEGYGYEWQNQYLNIGSIRNQGWELRGTGSRGPFTATTTYSWTKSRVLGIAARYRSLLSNSQYQPGASFDFLPEHTWAANVSYSRARTTVALNVDGVGFRYRGHDDVSVAVGFPRLSQTRPRMNMPTTYRPIGSGYATANLNASQRFSRSIEGVLHVQNLTDYYQSDASAILGTVGRQTRAGLRIKM